jgi:hypothetical protein
VLKTAFSTLGWRRIGPCTLVLATVSITALAIVVPAYVVGKKDEDSRRFLQNYRVPNFSEVVVTVKMNDLASTDEPNDALFVGDSTCLTDLRPNTFERITGLTAYNLGLPGYLEMRGVMLVLHRYLERHPKPKLVVLCVHPLNLGGERGQPEFRDRCWWCYGPGTADARPPHDAFGYYVSHGVWVLIGELTGGLAARLNEPLAGQTRTRMTLTSVQAGMKSERGHFILSPRETAEYQSRGVPDPPFAVSAGYSQGFRDFAQFRSRNEIKLLIRFPPIFSVDSPENDDAFSALRAQLNPECPTVAFSDPPLLRYDPIFFYDKLHCNLNGVEKVTAFVAEEAARALAVVGPPRRPPLGQVGSEEHDQGSRRPEGFSFGAAALERREFVSSPRTGEATGLPTRQMDIM